LQQRLADKVTAQALSKYENDEMMPSSGVLLALARVLGVSVSYLMSPDEVIVQAVEFRRRQLSSRDTARLEARVTDALQRYLLIEDLLNVASVDWEKPRQAPFPVGEIAEADRVARKLRDFWQLGADPLPNFAEFLEEKGIKVVMAEMPEKVDGLMCHISWRDRSAVPVIVINEHKNVSGERARFTLAHEVGHLMMQCGAGVDPEKAANRFAAALLAPTEVLWSEVGKQRASLSIGELIELKRVFGASLQTLAYRCHDLHIIGDELYRSLLRQFKENGWRDPPYDEPAALAKERPRRFVRLCMRALAEEAITESKAAELLGKSVRELDRWMQEGVA
jgi:Zn-dependent peptidase ImmA (M78 family)